MFKLWKNILFVLCLIASQANASIPFEKREKPIPITTTVAIPCCGKHFHLLDPLLNYYANQTQWPDELIISLSDVKIIPKNAIDALEQHPWPFPLKIIRNEEPETAGGNRNIATKHCSTDIILFQDADDIPHPQRVEIVKFIFEHYQIDHLIHLWIPPQFSFTTYVPEELELVYRPEFHFDAEYVYIMHNGWKCGIHNGNISMTQKLARASIWKCNFDGDRDVDFNVAIYKEKNRTGVLRAPLMIYRNELSSFRKN